MVHHPELRFAEQRMAGKLLAGIWGVGLSFSVFLPTIFLPVQAGVVFRNSAPPQPKPWIFDAGGRELFGSQPAPLLVLARF